MTIKDIDGRISILSSYDDSIRITIEDKTSGVTFVDIELTREQFVNATMNRLASSNVKKMTVRYLDLVGKKMVMKSFSFEVKKYRDEEEAREKVKSICPEGWVPDLGFGSQGSFYTKGDKVFARTTIRQWVDDD